MTKPNGKLDAPLGMFYCVVRLDNDYVIVYEGQSEALAAKHWNIETMPGKGLTPQDAFDNARFNVSKLERTNP